MSTDTGSININNSYSELKLYYSKLNKQKEHFYTSNDVSTDLNCVEEMINVIPDDFWLNKEIKILDPCCGNGNFFIPILFKLLKNNDKKVILENALYFNDVNNIRINNVKDIYLNNQYNLNIFQEDFLTSKKFEKKYDLIVANPPYAKLLPNGKRASKNHNLIKLFLTKALSVLNDNGYLLFITPDNWMSYADRNTIIEELTKLQILHLDIHTSKKYFKGIGSSFTWYLIQNCNFYKDINISGIWRGKYYNSSVKSRIQKFIPLLYTKTVQSILDKTILSKEYEKFDILTSSDLHKYTKKNIISNVKDDVFKYRLIHTPKQTVYSSRPHKYQDGYKVFISTTDKYNVFIDNCGMTQSIAFILCSNKNQANLFRDILNHPLYMFINNICRWGNFNNIRILQQFPFPCLELIEEEDIFKYFNINNDEINFITNNI